MADKPRTPVVGGRYQLLQKIGAGSFGNIYMGLDAEADEVDGPKRVAVKIERKDAPHQMVPNEQRCYRLLAGGKGIPRVLWCGEEGEYFALVLELLGPSLQDLFVLQRNIFSVSTTLLLADQLFERIEHVHKQGLLHRDIKPANFIIGDLNDAQGRNVVHIIDFGLARPYRDAAGGHIAYRDGLSASGTARFASFNSSYGREQSRRDDLESLMYMLIYFAKGSLPWQNLKRPKSRKDKHAHLAQKKQEHAQGLCTGLPLEFASALKYCSELGFEADPDYAHLRGMFRRCYLRHSSKGDAFDWKDKKLLGFYDTPQKAARVDEDSSSVELVVPTEPDQPVVPLGPSPEQLETQRKRSLILNFGGGKRMKSSPSITPLPAPAAPVPAEPNTPEEALLHARTLALTSLNGSSRSRGGGSRDSGSSSSDGMVVPAAQTPQEIAPEVVVADEATKEPKRELTGTELKAEGELKDCYSSFFS
jgi:serine/threonine protein kinase